MITAVQFAMPRWL